MIKKSNMSNMLQSLIPISVLNQGKAAKIISSLNKDEVKIVVKNNEPMAAIISIERFSELLDKEEAYLDLKNK